jgi:hypothetical protein
MASVAAPFAASRTALRRLQRRHTMQCYRRLKDKLLALLTPTPPNAIHAHLLEQFRFNLYHSATSGAVGVMLDGISTAGPHCRLVTQWRGVWEPLPYGEGRGQLAPRMAVHHDRQVKGDCASAQQDQIPGPTEAPRPRIGRARRMQRPPSLVKHVPEYIPEPQLYYAELVDARCAAEGRSDEHPTCSDRTDIHCRIISNMKVMVLSSPNVAAVTSTYIRPGHYFSAVAQHSCMGRTFFELPDQCGFVPLHSRKDVTKQVVQHSCSSVPDGKQVVYKTLQKVPLEQLNPMLRNIRQPELFEHELKKHAALRLLLAVHKSTAITI